MKIYITHLLQILNFSSPFRRFEIKNFLCRPTMVAGNISNLVALPELFSFLRAWNVYKLINCANIEKSQKQPSFYLNKFLYWIM